MDWDTKPIEGSGEENTICTFHFFSVETFTTCVCIGVLLLSQVYSQRYAVNNYGNMHRITHYLSLYRFYLDKVIWVCSVMQGM